MAKVKDIAMQIRGVSYHPEDLHDNLDEDSVVLLRANNIKDGKLILDDVVYVSKSKVAEQQYLQTGDILICASSGSKELVGKAAFVDSVKNPMTFGAFCKVVRPQPEYSEYLGHYFNSPVYRRKISALSAGANINNIKNEHIDNLDIRLDEEKGRKKVVSVLNKLNKLIFLREQQLAKLDELVKSQFTEMFGDPINNPMKWIVSKIEDIAAQEKNALKAGPFGSALKKEFYVRSGYKIYGQEQVICGDASFGDYYIDEEKYKELKNCAVQAGDILISLVGTYGKTLIMPDNYEAGIINPRLMKITLNKNKVTPIYFKYYFESNALKASMDANTHGGTMGILNLGIIRQMKVQVPPLSLQNQFATFVERVDQQKQTLQQSLDKLELMKKVLMQEYFG
jgi:type I restriction enzyme S subunit